MAATLIRLDQLRNTDNPDDTLSAAAIAGIESSAVDHHEFLTGILSQVKRILYGSDSGNWFDDVESAGDSLKDLASRATLEGKYALAYRLNLNDVSIPSSQNYVALTGTSKPDKNIAISNSNEGAVVAQLAGAIGSHSLIENGGSNSLRPKNFVAVFDGATGDPILSSGRRVWALLQVGSSATDGNAFGDSGNDQGQLSFVRANSTNDDLEAVPVSDIENQSVVYGFTNRSNLNDMPEESFRGDIESADPQAGVTVSLDSAYDGGHYMEVDGNDVDIRLADTKSWIVRAGSSGSILWQLLRNDSTGDKLTLNLDDLDINNANTADFAQGVKVDSSDQAINVGATAAGLIDSTSLELRATTGNAELAAPSGEVQFTTQRDVDLELDDATTGPISTLFSQSFSSVAAAIKYAGEHGGVDFSLKVFTASSHYGRDVNVPGAIQDISQYPIDMNSPSSVKQLVFLNGRLLYGGNATTNNDVYAGDTPANGDVKFDFRRGIRSGDVVISVVLSQ